jgi:hypothetical protein
VFCAKKAVDDRQKDQLENIEEGEQRITAEINPRT